MKFNQNIPLAERVRPKSVEEFIGQKHLLDKGKPIFVMMERKILSSLILWGPPGSGKTTLARLLTENVNADLIKLNAVSSGVKDIREAIERAEKNKLKNVQTVLFIDEIHRFNKAQQDSLLNPVETGLIILIGATTENPSFEIIPALRSRMRVFVLNPLCESELEQLLFSAVKKDEMLSKIKIEIPALKLLIQSSGGDARVLLSILESVIIQNNAEGKIVIDEEKLAKGEFATNYFYDKEGEEHFNLISAFIKSLRGSDPDAALYYMARLLLGGADPLFIARRMIVFASEDIGNASPNALLLADAAFSAVEKIGMPEGRIVLSQCATYLASSPKSNSSYMAIEKAYKAANEFQSEPVPLHLRNAPTGLMKSLGYSKDYKYPHNYQNNFVQENYFPEKLRECQFYFPSEHGNEKSIKERLSVWWKGKKKY